MPVHGKKPETDPVATPAVAAESAARTTQAAAEQAARLAGDAAAQADIAAEATARAADVDDELTRAQAAEAAEQARALAAEAAEASSRAAQDATLAAADTAEAGTRAAADTALTNADAAEASARAAAVSAEATARLAAAAAHEADTTDVHGIPDTTKLVKTDTNGRLPLGVLASATVDTVDSRLAVRASSDTENAITIKSPGSTWGATGTPYGTGQAIEILKASAAPSDIGYSGQSPQDLVIARITGEGSLGFGGNLHVATGLRQPAGYASGYAIFIQPYVDTQHIAMQSVAGQTNSFLRAIDSTGNELFKVLPTGNVRSGMVNNAGGLISGDVGAGTAGYFGIAHNSNAGSSTGYALAQGAAGDTLVNAKTGQTVTLRVNNAAMLTVSSTVVTIAAELKHTGSKAGFFNAVTVAKPTVTGAKGSNAALASLLAALSSLGLVTDSSTA